uniref:TPR_REGION domain-containing protein n=1 Tax=Angiostrongylus cantonensis TaxID=6313 RepID=A0A0K0D378_ANGCA
MGRQVVHHFRSVLLIRLSIASEFDDKESQYIAYINIGNACVQLCNSNEAMRYYKAALELAVEISSRSKKSKCYFCLTKAAYNIQDYHRAEMCCLNYLALARELNDFTSISRAYHWLARVYSKLGDYPKAAYFLACFRALAVEIRDENLATVAVESLKQLVMQHGCFVVSEDGSIKFDSSRDPEPQSHVCLVRTVSGSRILTFTNEPISELVCSNGTAQEERHDLESASAAPRNSEDAFLDLVSRVQSSRLDEQRCDISIMSSRTVAGRRKTDGKMVTPKDCENNANIEEVFTIGEALDSNVEQSLEREKCHCAKKNMHDPESRRFLVDPVLGAQATKMNEQPAMLLPGLKIEKENLDIINKLRRTSEEGVDSKVDEALIDLLMNAQEQRMNDQRSDPVTVINSNYVDCGSLDEFSAEEELSVTVMRMQAGRLEDQRVRLKTP